MHCPKCVRHSLKEKRVAGTDVRVDVCPTCQGIWFDTNELNDVLPVASKGLTLPNDAEDTGMTCPKCRKPLEAFDYPQTRVKIEMCEECNGLWLDSGEFKKIKAVRRRLEEEGRLEEQAPVSGFKGRLLDFINSAISQMSTFD